MAPAGSLIRDWSSACLSIAYEVLRRYGMADVSLDVVLLDEVVTRT